MALNQKYDDDTSLSLPVPADTASGVAVLVGALCGTTRCAEGTGGHADGYASVDLKGAFEQTIAGALKPGTAVYMIGTPDGNGLLAGALTATSTSNTLWGYSLTTKGSGSGLATVRPARV